MYISGLLHDIGKIAVPEAILNKPGKLTDEEFEIMKSHPTRGAEIIGPLSLDDEIVHGVLHHHERWDGKGYPQGLAGEDIPMMAAVMAVGDAFDAMTTDRPYRKGMSKEDAIAEVRKNKGTQFHPDAADAMVELFEEGKI